MIKANKNGAVWFKFSFVIAAVLLTISVNFDNEFLTLFLRFLSLATLLVLYWFSSTKKSKIYLIALFFALVSHLLFNYSNFNLLLIGLIAFLIFRLLVVVQVVKISEDIHLVPFALGTFLFAIPIIYLFYITSETLGLIFYFGILNIILNAILGGISISNYSFQNNLQNTNLLISTLLFVILSVLFIIQKFYLYIDIYEPLRVLLLLTGHYFYYNYLILNEKEKV